MARSCFADFRHLGGGVVAQAPVEFGKDLLAAPAGGANQEDAREPFFVRAVSGQECGSGMVAEIQPGLFTAAQCGLGR